MHDSIENLYDMSIYYILCIFFVLPKIFQRDLIFFLNQCKCHIFNDFFNMVPFHLGTKEFHICITHEVKCQSLCSREKRARFICRVRASLNSFAYCSFYKKLHCATKRQNRNEAHHLNVRTGELSHSKLIVSVFAFNFF